MAQWFPKSPPPGVVLAEHPDGKFELSQAAKKAGWQKGIVLMDIKGPEDYPEDFKRQDIAAMNVLARMLVEKHPPGTQVLLKAVVTSYIRQLKKFLLQDGIICIRGLLTLRVKSKKANGRDYKKISIRVSNIVKSKVKGAQGKNKK